MITKATREKGQMQFLCIDQLVPQEHIVRKVENAIDFDFVYELVKDLYAEDGRPCIDPVTLIKLPVIQYLFGKKSMRQTIRDIQTDMALRWFCSLDLFDEVPHFSTFGKNYERRFKGTDIFEKIFDRILDELISHGFVDTSVINIDSTHIQADANYNKYKRELVKIERKKYQDELEKEMDEQRESQGRPKLKLKEHQTEREESISTTDHDARIFKRGDHKRCFAYLAHTACDRNGVVLKTVVTAGNVNDHTAFSEVFQPVVEKHEVEKICLDNGYSTPAVLREVVKAGVIPVMPKRAVGGSNPKEGGFTKKACTYDKSNDTYITPDGEVFFFSTIDAMGYKIYRPKAQGKSDRRNVKRHMWQEYLDVAAEFQLTPEWESTYQIRKETIEPTFGTAKVLHNLRRTNLRGLAKNQMMATLTFACMNLKKLAKWKSKTTIEPQKPSPISSFFLKIVSLLKFAFLFRKTRFSSF